MKLEIQKQYSYKELLDNWNEEMSNYVFKAINWKANVTLKLNEEEKRLVLKQIIGGISSDIAAWNKDKIRSNIIGENFVLLSKGE